jgi:hypothetical protein
VEDIVKRSPEGVTLEAFDDPETTFPISSDNYFPGGIDMG